jgi:hypothetical protein
LIIDDCSSDDTAAVGQRLAQQDRRIEFRRHPTNRGHIATYNEGLLEWASADYSLLLSADDALATGALARATALMDRHSNVGMTYGLALIITENDALTATLDVGSNDYRIVPSSQFLQYCCATGNPVPTPTAIVRTELQHRLGGYYVHLPHSCDAEMWMRFAVHAPVGVIQAVQGYYRRHSRNMSLRYYSQVLKDHREVMDACKQALTGCGPQFPEASLWLNMTYKRLAEEAFWLASSAFDNADPVTLHTCLQFAEDIYPPLRRSPMWWRLRAKRLLGQPLWRHIQPAVNHLRSLPDISTKPLQTARRRPANLIGRWPE